MSEHPIRMIRFKNIHALDAFTVVCHLIERVITPNITIWVPSDLKIVNPNLRYGNTQYRIIISCDRK